MQKTIKQVLDGMLSRREYSVAEAKRKLLRLGFIEASVDAIIEDYVNRGFLSNDRYVEARVMSLMRRGYGPFYVQKKLELEGVSLGNQSFDWSEAYQVALRKAGKREGYLLKQYLFRRGFNYENIDTSD